MLTNEHDHWLGQAEADQKNNYWPDRWKNKLWRKISNFELESHSKFSRQKLAEKDALRSSSWGQYFHSNERSTWKRWRRRRIGIRRPSTRSFLWKSRAASTDVVFVNLDCISQDGLRRHLLHHRYCFERWSAPGIPWSGHRTRRKTAYVSQLKNLKRSSTFELQAGVFVSLRTAPPPIRIVAESVPESKKASQAQIGLRFTEMDHHSKHIIQLYFHCNRYKLGVIWTWNHSSLIIGTACNITQ